ncbi:H-type small acid-soluble spore protein [Microbacteriaceae bacterium 4G12]
MDVKRVKQVLSSSANITVEYHGVPIWIESCDEASGVANVHDLDYPQEKVQVKVEELEELT